NQSQELAVGAEHQAPSRHRFLLLLRVGEDGEPILESRKIPYIDDAFLQDRQELAVGTERQSRKVLGEQAGCHARNYFLLRIGPVQHAQALGLPDQELPAVGCVGQTQHGTTGLLGPGSPWFSRPGFPKVDLTGPRTESDLPAIGTESQQTITRGRAVRTK